MDLLTGHAINQPDKVAVIDDRRGRHVEGDDVRIATYAELERRANRLAHVLRDHGVTTGDKVVWCGQNSMGIVEMVNAARKVGAVAVPLNYRLADDEAAYVVDHLMPRPSTSTQSTRRCSRESTSRSRRSARSSCSTAAPIRCPTG
ncbi:MAG: AMP-binding protein [Ilumatobacteraceae bacterium]